MRSVTLRSSKEKNWPGLLWGDVLEMKSHLEREQLRAASSEQPCLKALGGCLVLALLQAATVQHLKRLEALSLRLMPCPCPQPALSFLMSKLRSSGESRKLSTIWS